MPRSTRVAYWYLASGGQSVWETVLDHLINKAFFAVLLITAGPALAAPQADPTAIALQSCLDNPADASTAGQVDCETSAARSYDRRMNAAYSALMRNLPTRAAQQLQKSQRAWLAFHNAEEGASEGVFATRQGTMYVPMQAGAATNVTRDRVLQLESYLRIIAIEPGSA
jgi:uncharacterized protein YecT (DUF1311 family)